MDFSYQLSLTPRLLVWNALALKCIQFPDNEDFCEEAKLASLQCRLQLLGIELRIIVAVNSLPTACHSTPSHWKLQSNSPF